VMSAISNCCYHIFQGIVTNSE